jgi:Flp pilus assembly protein TadD
MDQTRCVSNSSLITYHSSFIIHHSLFLVVNHFPLKYRTAGKGLPPQPIRLDIPGWAGTAAKMEDGSVPQPWHCNPFVEGSTYGLELIYPYETACHVINDGGAVRIEWDYARERDSGVSGNEFVQFAPNHYGFNTSLDLQAPAGHVLRLEPHPRYFTDRTGTTPCPIIGNLQTEWWPKLFFVAFTAPLTGQRHIFRRGEPYAQIIVVPERASYGIQPMTAEEEDDRLSLEARLSSATDYVAEHSWTDHRGQPFNNKYKVLTRIFHSGGVAAVRRAILSGEQQLYAALPADATVEQALETARKLHQSGQFAESRAICYELLNRDPKLGDALHLLAASALAAQSPMLAVECLAKAVAAHPNSDRYFNDLGIAWLAAGRPDEAARAFERASQLQPRRPDVMANLAEALAQCGRLAEAEAAIERACAMAPAHPVVCFRAAAVHERAGRREQARHYYAQALLAQPNFAEARRRLDALERGGD